MAEVQTQSHNAAYAEDTDSIDGLFSKLYSNVSAILHSLSQQSYLVAVAFVAYFFLKFLVWMHTTALSCAIVWGFLYLINMAAESMVEFNEDCARIDQERGRTTALALTNCNQVAESSHLFRRARTLPAVKSERPRPLTFDLIKQEHEELMEHDAQAEFETPPSSQDSSCTALAEKIIGSKARSMPSHRTKTNFTMKSENLRKSDPQPDPASGSIE